MFEKMKLVAKRIVELREIVDISQEEAARLCNIDLETYRKYESGKIDMPISALYEIAGALKVDPTELMTGESPRMSTYTVVREERGVVIERYAGYKFTSLATNYIKRDMEPMIVYVSKHNQKADKLAHAGQEFNYVLEGLIAVHIGDKVFELKEKDCIYFNATIPHAQYAVTETARFLTVLNENSYKRGLD